MNKFFKYYCNYGYINMYLFSPWDEVYKWIKYCGYFNWAFQYMTLFWDKDFNNLHSYIIELTLDTEWLILCYKYFPTFHTIIPCAVHIPDVLLRLALCCEDLKADLTMAVKIPWKHLFTTSSIFLLSFLLARRHQNSRQWTVQKQSILAEEVMWRSCLLSLIISSLGGKCSIIVERLKPVEAEENETVGAVGTPFNSSLQVKYVSENF